MGWFDKKSWQLRRKIRDLQSELAVAEREGKYVVAQGLFFAELQEMGDATLMVLGTADHLDSEEAAMIKTFFERNGFTVEALRLDKSQKNLAAVEIIPPEELTRRVARILKDNGFKLIDDSEKERPSNLENQLVTLSCLIRSISALFVNHVHHLIVSTPLKMNMEGNRLLHWLPLIRDELGSRVPPELLSECRSPFVDAYNHYYGRFGRMEDTDLQAESTHDLPETLESSTKALSEASNSTETGSAPWFQTHVSEDTEISQQDDKPKQNLNSRAATYGSDAELRTSDSRNNGNRDLEAAHLLMRMYKTLIGASDQRKPRNAEILLEYIARFFNAKAACILARRNVDSPLTLVANSGGNSCVQTDTDGAVSCSSNTLEECLATHNIIIGNSINGNSNPSAVAAPLLLESTLDSLMYLVQPEAFHETDKSHLANFAQVFREFPDLLISAPVEKS